MSDNRPVRYVEDDGTVVYRASGLAMCDRIYVALDQGYDPMAFPEWFQSVLDEGTRMEDVIRTKWETDYMPGHTVTDNDQMIELEVMDGVIIRGSTDGRAGNFLWEAKKVRPSGWDAFKAKGVEWHKNYPMQFSAYMLGMDAEGGYFVGGLYDPDTEDIIDVYHHVYHSPPVNLLGLRKRIAKLEALINTKHAMDVACPSTPDYPCPFYYLHDDDAPEPKERPGDDIITPILEEMDTLANEKAPLAKRQREIDARVKALKEGIEGWYEASGLEPGEECVVGDYKVKLAEVARKGYTVEPGGYTKVTVKRNKETSK